MRGFVDLHCHFIANIDDGARSVEEGLKMLRALQGIGFDRVIATPHMRPGMFDNDQQRLTQAYQQMLPHLQSSDLPQTELASEHYFDDVVYSRILGGLALPYPGGKAVLIEFHNIGFPHAVHRCFAELRQHGLLPVIAHPERYQPLFKKLDALESLVDEGAAALLDTAALVGKYGSRPQHTAELILEQGLYHAACSDAHRPEDVRDVALGMERIAELYGPEEVEALFRTGPLALLDGRLP